MISTSTDLIKKESIAELTAHRDRAIELYGRAIDLLMEASKALNMAAPGNKYSIVEPNDFRWIETEQHARELVESLTKRVDQKVWRYLLDASGLGSLMDRTAKDEFHAQIEKNPPAATLDNVCATMLTKASEAGTIFERGLIEAFRKLDKSYRTNSTFKIGNKIVMKGALSAVDSKWKSLRHWAFYRKADDELLDIERTLSILDGNAPCGRMSGVVAAIDTATRDGEDHAETEYFSVRIFMNGNLHVTFKRSDLIEKANIIVAKHFGATVGAPKKDDRKKRAA